MIFRIAWDSIGQAQRVDEVLLQTIETQLERQAFTGDIEKPASLMITRQDWQELLYECQLAGQLWLHVDRVGAAYICWRTSTPVPFNPSPWQIKVQKMVEAFSANPEAAEETLVKYLSEPHYGANGRQSIMSEANRQRIVKTLRYIVNEKPNNYEWVN